MQNTSQAVVVRKITIADWQQNAISHFVRRSRATLTNAVDHSDKCEFFIVFSRAASLCDIDQMIGMIKYACDD